MRLFRRSQKIDQLGASWNDGWNDSWDSHVEHDDEWNDDSWDVLTGSLSHRSIDFVTWKVWASSNDVNGCR